MAPLDALPDWPLFGFADDARPALKRAMDLGEPAALATIIALDSGGPRPVGTQMVIAQGVVSGFLSGGCLEADVAGHAAVVLESGDAMRLVYGEGSPWPDIRLMCGARVVILLERIAPDDAAARRLLALAEARTPALWLSDGEHHACGPEDSPPQAWPGAFAKRFKPAPRLIVLGADPTALAMAALGAQAGWETTLVRPKGPAEAPPLPGVAYRRDEAGEALAAIGLDPWTAVAAATHDAELDHAALLAALPSPAFYVGALGSRRRRPDRTAWLEATGLTGAQVSRLHTPIGLELGGKAPWEVAIAALAEITAAWNGLPDAEASGAAFSIRS
ncbi:MAG TPA: XdhC family protein [Caulobacteraceae bacterium]|jgi:xanthine dehydrogenase accessory factor